MELEEVEEGDRVLFNGRKIPLEVEAVDENRIHVEGPQGGSYVIFTAEETGDLLLRNKESGRRYASYVENLRKTGEWKRNGDTWEHSISGARLELVEKETGFWTVKTDLDTELELPKYGFAEKEFAEEQIERIVKQNPEG